MTKRYFIDWCYCLNLQKGGCIIISVLKDEDYSCFKWFFYINFFDVKKLLVSTCKGTVINSLAFLQIIDPMDWNKYWMVINIPVIAQDTRVDNLDFIDNISQ